MKSVARTEKIYAKIAQWLWVKGLRPWDCPYCIEGRRVERRGLMRFVHPKDGKFVRCREPSQWILMEVRREARGH